MAALLEAFSALTCQKKVHGTTWMSWMRKRFSLEWADCQWPLYRVYIGDVDEDACAILHDETEPVVVWWQDKEDQDDEED
jgi:hypothetical protein